MNNKLKNLQISDELKQEIQNFYSNTCLSSSVHILKDQQKQFFELIEKVHKESKCDTYNTKN